MGRPWAWVGLPSPAVSVRGSLLTRPLSQPEAAERAAPGLFGVRAIKCERIPATQQGAQERRWKRHGRRLLIWLSIKDAFRPRRSARGGGEARPLPFRAPGQRLSRSPFAPSTESRAGGIRRRHPGGSSFSRSQNLVLRVAVDLGELRRHYQNPSAGGSPGLLPPA
ncbi:uncharacterized protein LOC144377063 [Ictidomys tridecemlineatus]